MLFFILIFVFSVRSGLELFATFNNIGITKTTTSSQCDDVTYCNKDGKVCQVGHPLSYVKRHGYFVGSIFWLKPGTEYLVKVNCGGGDVEEKTIKTRDELVEFTTPTKTLFVSSDGTGTECKENDPCDVYTVNQHIIPGTHVLFEDGIYYIGSVSISNGGTSDQPVVFKKKNENGKVIFDGSLTIPNSDFTKNGNIYETTIQIIPEKIKLMVYINKKTGKVQRLLRYHVSDELDELYFGDYGYYVPNGGSTIRINIGDENLDDYEILYSMRDYAIRWVSSNYYQIFGLHFRYYGNNICIAFWDSNYNWIKNSIIEHCSRCIALHETSDHNVIDENELFDSMFGMHWRGMKDAGGMETGSITIFNTRDERMCGRGLVIRNNVFHDWMDAFGAESQKNEKTKVTNEVEVYGNHIYNIQDDGFEVDGEASNVRIYNNYIDIANTGISVAPAMLGPTYIINNVFNNIFGAVFKFSIDIDDETGTVYMYHNIGIQEQWDPERHNSNMGMTGHVWQLATSRNNILLSHSYCWRVDPDNKIANVDMDYDTCYTNATAFGGFIMKWVDNSGKHFWKTFKELQDYTGQEMHGIQIYETNNVFIKNSANVFPDMFQLNENSELIGKGGSIPGVNNHFKEVDMGLMFTPDFLVESVNSGEENSAGDAFVVTFTVMSFLIILCFLPGVCCCFILVVCLLAVLVCCVALCVLGFGSLYFACHLKESSGGKKNEFFVVSSSSINDDSTDMTDQDYKKLESQEE